MSQTDPTTRLNFICPKQRYYGDWTPQHVVFNANLQEFAQQVSYISALQTNGKLSPQQAFEDIKYLWERLEKSQAQLGIDEGII
jgi:hypothetical protein